MFEKTYLDAYYMRSLQRLLYQENCVKPSRDWHLEAMRARRNSLRKKTLLLLTLFEKVDGNMVNPEVGDWLWDNGLISTCEPMLIDRDVTQERQRLYPIAHHIAYQVLKVYKKVVLPTHLQMSPDSYYVLGSKPTLKEEQGDFPNKYITLRTWGTLSSRDLHRVYDQCIDELYEDDGFSHETTWEAPLLCEFIEDMAADLSDIVAASLFDSVQVASRFASIHLNSRNIQPALDDIECIAHVMLRDEIKILPNPSSLKEVLELRERVEIRRFREVVSEWVSIIQDGRVDNESRIRRDIATANKDLRRLKQWQEFKESPIAFWISAIGGHVPLFSNLLTLVSTFGDKAFSNWTDRRSGWAMIIQ